MMTDSLSEQFMIQVGQQGQITIPLIICQKLGIADDDYLHLVLVEYGVLLIPKQIQTSALADKLADMLDEEGISLADLLNDLPQIRAEIYRERYGDPKTTSQNL